MSGTSFPHLVRGLLVAASLLLAMTQVKLLVSEPTPTRALDTILPVTVVAR